jgi:hypothetical protein
MAIESERENRSSISSNLNYATKKVKNEGLLCENPPGIAFEAEVKSLYSCDSSMKIQL